MTDLSFGLNPIKTDSNRRSPRWGPNGEKLSPLEGWISPLMSGIVQGGRDNSSTASRLGGKTLAQQSGSQDDVMRLGNDLFGRTAPRSEMDVSFFSQLSAREWLAIHG